MTGLTRRGFLTTAAAATALRATPPAAPLVAAKLAQAPATRRVLELVYDKGLGMMRAVERVVPALH